MTRRERLLAAARPLGGTAPVLALLGATTLAAELALALLQSTLFGLSAGKADRLIRLWERERWIRHLERSSVPPR